ncbi:unnamed protein product [Lepeophtheirus salmonis]|uniref:(salmon louse) hypothetical protein n=1 Tax=Lepeophtheirus salmonis TaxID=72036 RepID=A0A7R8HDP6_LEPSM|nr:unnamed protein product [Lepeophtheirus salmonis]CAF3027461.1 unnamed protein product [Lepeophtheirus salmonis]
MGVVGRFTIGSAVDGSEYTLCTGKVDGKVRGDGIEIARLGVPSCPSSQTSPVHQMVLLHTLAQYECWMTSWLSLHEQNVDAGLNGEDVTGIRVGTEEVHLCNENKGEAGGQLTMWALSLAAG